MTHRPHRGFTLVELMVSLVIAGVVGIALSRLIISQARLLSLQDATLHARSGARAAYLTLANELRPVGVGGVLQAAPESVTVRIPYAFGVACQQSSGTTIVGLLPADSAALFGATPAGYAWRDSTGVFHSVNGATVADWNAALTSCSGATPPVTVLAAPGWSPRAIAVSPNQVATPVGAPVFLYTTIRYGFAASVEYPGKLGLWRTDVAAGIREELAAPYAAGSVFRYLVGPQLQLQLAPPANLNDVYGLFPDVTNQSELPPQGRSAPVDFRLGYAVVFRNVPVP